MENMYTSKNQDTASCIGGGAYLFIIIFNLCFYSLQFISCSTAASSATILRDGDGDSLVSDGQRFQLGFFTPQDSFDGRRYVGIWYYGLEPRVVVWVANRDHALYEKNGVLGIFDDGNLKIQDSVGKSLPLSNVPIRKPARNRRITLMDSGNLVLMENNISLWESFQNPTDTYLPEMEMTQNLKLTSWKSAVDPASGNFSFLRSLEGEGVYIIEKKSTQYWVSRGFWQNYSVETDGEIFQLFNLFSNISVENLKSVNYVINFQNQKLDYNYTRLVMNITGKIQLLSRNKVSRTWDLIWTEPKDKCSELTVCGKFASCRSETWHSCSCLPGFEPKFKDKWNTGDFADGCKRKSEICIEENANAKNFLPINMKVKKTSNIVRAKDYGECRTRCLESCKCEAYSEITTFSARSGDKSVACAIWEDELQNIWEYTDGGGDVYIRYNLSDVELTKRDCPTCGSYVIPYPLATETSCGDPMYLNFTCEAGRVHFLTTAGNYNVTNINPEQSAFKIKTNKSICAVNDINTIQQLLNLKNGSRFYVSGGCDSGFNNTISNFLSEDEFFNEVEIKWEKPLEPKCNTSVDCIIWSNSKCNSSTDGTKRCLCNPSFEWKGYSCDLAFNPTLTTPKHKNLAVSLIVLPFVAVLIVISCLVFFVYHRKRKLQIQQDSEKIDRQNWEIRLYDSEKLIKEFIRSGEFGEEDKKAIDVPVFYLETILAATDNFSDENKIGQGGFGAVYKGKFPGGLEIAIKRLSKGSSQGVDEFKNEVVLIAKLQHRNLVRLLGYCVAEEEKMLIYEYLPNKSLDFFIFDPKESVRVNWEMRFNIIVGIVRGLVYLHEDSRLRVIHRDLKLSNVLLDEDMDPKISDFGLARIFDGRQTEATTNTIVGTYGYMSPEYALDGSFSIKSDVFSFGIVILEIVSGRRNIGYYRLKEADSLLGHVWKLWKNEKPLEIADTVIGDTCNPSEVIKCINVGLLCVEEDPNDRPTMSSVAFMLSSGSDTASLPRPKQPAFTEKMANVSTSTPTATSSSSIYKQEISSDYISDFSAVHSR